MASEYKVTATRKGTSVTFIDNVPKNFADEYHEKLEKGRSMKSDAMSTAVNVPKKKPQYKSKFEKKNEGKYATFNYAKRIKTRRSKFKALVENNFLPPNTQFVTLTFDSRIFEQADNLEVCHKAFQKFIKRVRHQFDDFQYLAVFAKQKNGHWHYHMICNFDETVSGKTIHALWTYGITENTVIISESELNTKSSYCVDNMLSVAWENLQGAKGYLCSKGLQSAFVSRSWKPDEMQSAEELVMDIHKSDYSLTLNKKIKLGETLDTNHSQDTLENSSANDSEENAPTISFLRSQMRFPELFKTPPVAKKK